MTKQKTTYGPLEATPGQKEKIRDYIQLLTSPETPRKMAREWLSSLSLEELKQEQAWIESLIQEKAQGRSE